MEGRPCWWPARVVKYVKHEHNLDPNQRIPVPTSNDHYSTVECFDQEKAVSVVENEFICEYTTNMHLARPSGRPLCDVLQACRDADNYFKSNPSALRSQVRRYKEPALFEKSGNSRAPNSRNSTSSSRNTTTRTPNSEKPNMNNKKRHASKRAVSEITPGLKKQKLDTNGASSRTQRVKSVRVVEDYNVLQQKQGKLEAEITKLKEELEKEREDKWKLQDTLTLEQCTITELKKELQVEKMKKRLKQEPVLDETQKLHKQINQMEDELHERKMQAEIREKEMGKMKTEFAAEREKMKFQEKVFSVFLDQKTKITSLEGQLSAERSKMMNGYSAANAMEGLSLSDPMHPVRRLHYPSSSLSSPLAMNRENNNDYPLNSNSDDPLSSQSSHRNNIHPTVDSPNAGPPAALANPSQPCLPTPTSIVPSQSIDNMGSGAIVSASWSAAEDERLAQVVHLEESNALNSNPAEKWPRVASQFEGRTRKQCQERWLNHLKLRIGCAYWTDEEELILRSAIEELGFNWVAIAQRLPGRTHYGAKNHWYSMLKKRQRREEAAEQHSTEPQEEIRDESMGMAERAEAFNYNPAMGALKTLIGKAGSYDEAQVQEMAILIRKEISARSDPSDSNFYYKNTCIVIKKLKNNPSVIKPLVDELFLTRNAAHFFD